MKKMITPVLQNGLDEKYMNEIPHKSIEAQNLEIAPEDFVVLPEIFGFVMDQIQKFTLWKNSIVTMLQIHL
jgi:hypothetical protein